MSIEEFRSKVPVVSEKGVLYFNSSSRTPMNTIVANAISELIGESLYEPDPVPNWDKRCDEIRLKLGNFINCQPEDITFTRDTNEGCNLFQRSILFQKGDNVVILENEFPNQSYAWLGLVSKGLEVRVIPVAEASGSYFDANTFKDYVDQKTKAIGLSSVMYDNGMRNNIKEICAVYRPNGIHVLVDATQDIGFSKIDVKELGVSAMVGGLFKGLNCPKGLGFLYIDPETILKLSSVPPMLGASSISNLDPKLKLVTDFECFNSTRRYDHFSNPRIQIFALGAQLDFLTTIGIENVQLYLETLSSLLRSKLREIGIETIGSENHFWRSAQCNVIPITNSKWNNFLSEHNVYATQNRCGIRLSLGIYNNETDVEKLVKVFEKGLKMAIPLT